MEGKHAADMQDMEKVIRKAEKRGSRKGFFKRIMAFFLGILVGVLILTGVSAYRHGKSVAYTFKSFFRTEESVEGHDMTLRNFKFFGYKVADFEDAILGDEEELKKLEVYSRAVSDVVTLTQAGLGKIEAFTKYQYITFHGNAIYTVDLSKLKKGDISMDEDSKTVTIKVPKPVLEPINIPSEDIEFGEVEKKSIFAFGDIKVTPEEQAKVETEAKNKMMERLEEDNVQEEAEMAAEHAVWEIFQPMVSGVSGKYSLKVEFK